MWITALLVTRAEAASAPGQKFTEPVAFSSTVPTNLRLAPTVLRNSFGLLTLRARCKTNLTAAPRGCKENPAAQTHFAGIYDLRLIRRGRNDDRVAPLPARIDEVCTERADGGLPGRRRHQPGLGANGAALEL